MDKKILVKKLLASVALVFFLSFLIPPAQAVVPKLLTYQGILKDSAGNFLTGTYSMVFKIYDAATAGNELWSETQSTVSVSSGRFTVQLGSVTLLNLGFGSDYWLGIKVGTDSEMTPRARLTSAGYSLIAEDVTGGKLTGSQHAADSHMSIEGVRSAHTNIAKTNFKLDAYTQASANSMGDLIIDNFNDATGIDANQSSSYSWRGSPNYDVVAGSQGGIDSNTVLMLHANGTDASSNFTDSSSSAKSVTAIGTAQIDTAQSEFGGSSALFAGGNDYLSAADSSDFNFASGDFTVDFWARWNGSVMDAEFIGNMSSAGVGWSVLFLGGQLRICHNSYTTQALMVAWTPSANIWYHIAVARSGNNMYFFVNGTQQGAAQNASGKTYNSDGSEAFKINGKKTLGGGGFSGWIDEVRISKGVARWTSNFTPPTSEYTVPGSGNGTVISTLFTEPAVFSEAMVITSETLGTGSITYYISRNNGTNWTQCTNEQVCSLTAQPSGTQLRWKAVISGNAELDAMGVSV